MTIALRSFAGGLLLGIGALVVMIFNGVFLGAASVHLAQVHYGSPFFSFIVAHSAPELTAIVLSGGAGMQLGMAWLLPGQRSRLAALQQAARETLPVIYGVLMLLFVAALTEAFWSSLHMPLDTKYLVGGLFWLLLYTYLLFGGRREA